MFHKPIAIKSTILISWAISLSWSNLSFTAFKIYQSFLKFSFLIKMYHYIQKHILYIIKWYFMTLFKPYYSKFVLVLYCFFSHVMCSMTFSLNLLLLHSHFLFIHILHFSLFSDCCWVFLATFSFPTYWFQIFMSATKTSIAFKIFTLQLAYYRRIIFRFRTSFREMFFSTCYTVWCFVAAFLCVTILLTSFALWNEFRSYVEFKLHSYFQYILNFINITNIFIFAECCRVYWKLDIFSCFLFFL